ncbi:MAG TPA: hypothetical protein VGC18_10530 [Lacisediminihabitans sp.]|uniref:hypothetical protein n=1 Tax=Lacisediminihabitans sp. TaxID=2787631 RepID=UPI002ED89566
MSISTVRAHARQLGFGFIAVLTVSGIVLGAWVAEFYLVVVALITDPPTALFALFIFPYVMGPGALAGAIAGAGGAIGHVVASLLGGCATWIRVGSVAAGAALAITAWCQWQVVDGTTKYSNIGGLGQFVPWIVFAGIAAGGLFWGALSWRLRYPRSRATKTAID